MSPTAKNDPAISKPSVSYIWNKLQLRLNQVPPTAKNDPAISKPSVSYIWKKSTASVTNLASSKTSVRYISDKHQLQLKQVSFTGILCQPELKLKLLYSNMLYICIYSQIKQLLEIASVCDVYWPNVDFLCTKDHMFLHSKYICICRCRVSWGQNKLLWR